MLNKEDYKTLVSKIHYSLTYHEAHDEIFYCLEKLEELIEEYFKLLDSRDRWKEIAHIFDEALREYQRKYGE